jgi:hypothetical protein
MSSGPMIGAAAALGASSLYAAGIVLQAGEARATGPEHALRLSLLRRLVARPRWVLGTALGLAGWGLQALALAHASLTLVQPLLGASLVFVVVLAVWLLGERPTAGVVAASVAVAAGAPLLAVTAPDRAEHAAGAALPVALAALGALALVPLALRGEARAGSVLVPLGAGVAYAWDGLATKLASDDALGHAWLAVAAWFLAMNAASGLGTLSEMSALQRRAVTQVAPLVFAVTTLVPVALAPVVAGEAWPSSPARDATLVVALLLTAGGALGLAGSDPVGRALSAEASSSSSDTGRSTLEAKRAITLPSDARA